MDVKRIVFCGPSIEGHKESRREQVQTSLKTFAWSGADFLDLRDILDLAQGLASPALGLIAAGARLNVLFLVSAGTVLCAAFVALWLMAHPTNLEGSTQ